MATRAVSTTIEYTAWDTSANAGKTGDVANHTLKWIKDGTAASPTNSASEVDATNCPGQYKITLTSTETDCLFGCLAGKSSTSNIVLIPTKIGFVYAPTSSTTFGAFIGNGTAALAVDASGYTTFNNTSIGTVTTLTNLPSIPSNWLTAAGIAASALNGKGDWNVGKTGYALTTAYDAAKTASQAGDAMALTSSERDSTADALLGRNVAGGSSTGRLVKEALYFLRNKWSISSGTLTVYGTDDTTSAWTATVGTDGTANPIVSNDPA